jgi:multiple sugar transport system substrate-binding protein
MARGLTRREAIARAGAGAAALALPGALMACGGSDAPPTPVSGDEWRQFAGTTINFISENTAPTSAIAANVKPFTDLTGINVKFSQLELSALVQKVALDFASGIGAYDVVYADPYQVLAPYHAAMAELNAFNDDPNLPKVQDLDDFIPTQLDAVLCCSGGPFLFPVSLFPVATTPPLLFFFLTHTKSY